MKKILVFSWSAILLIILFFVIRSLSQREVLKNLYQQQVTSQVCFTPETFCNLKSPGKSVLLTITSEGCDVCKLIHHHPLLEQLPLIPCIIEREFCPNNMLVSQVLPAYGFPSSFLFDEHQNIIGYFRGIVEVEENIQTVLLKKDDLPADSLQMLTNAFKSFLAYLNHDLQGMHHYAQKSLDYQSYFFNNYLQYVYHRDMLHADSAEIYKTRALQSLEGADIFVYETLVREMAPHHPMLDWISEAVHVHDAHCRHKSPDPQS